MANSVHFSGIYSRTRLYNIRVIESFRGGYHGGDFVTVETGFGGGDCGYDFVIGGKYLIDAAKQENTLLTSICSLTAPLAQSEAELRILRMIAAGQRLPDVTGVLVRGAGAPDEQPAPLAGVAIDMRAVNNGVRFKTVTDAIGVFTFFNLPQGTYRISLGLPVGLDISYTDIGAVVEDQIPPLLLEHKDGEPAACYFHIFVGPSGSISGVAKSSDGGLVDGWVKADTVTQDGKPWNTVASTIPTPNGVFRLAHLKSGRYQIQFTSRGRFVEGAPQVIDLREGERRTGLVLHAR